MKKSITILALACLAVVSIRAQYYMRQVNSLADLVNVNPSDLYKTYNVVNRTSENDGFGGMFYLTNNATGTNLGTKIALATNGWSAVRIYSSPVNVRWFGADATGSADSTAAIQAAIDAASGTTKAVYVPKGTYKLVTGITIPGRVKFFGDNQLNSVLQFTPTADSGTAITVSASDNTYIEDIYLIKSGSFTNLTGIAIASTGTTTELKMRRVTVDGFDKYGLNLTTTSFTAYNEIQSCRFLNNRRTDANTNNPPAVAIYAAPNQIHATTIANCRFGGNDHIMELRAKGDGLVIRDNQFESSGLNAAGTARIGTNLFDTILIDQAEGLVFSGNYVEKNAQGNTYAFLNLTNCNSPNIVGGMFYNDTASTLWTTNTVKVSGTSRNARIVGVHFNELSSSSKFVSAVTEGSATLEHCTFNAGGAYRTTISAISPYLTNCRVLLDAGTIGQAANDSTTPILQLDRGTRKHSIHQNNDFFVIRDVTANKDRVLLNTSGRLGVAEGGTFPSGGASRTIHTISDDLLTNSITYGLRLEHTLAGSDYATNNHGVGIEFYGDREEGGTNSTTGIMGAIDAQWSDPKVGQEDSILRLRPVLNGTATDAIFVSPNLVEQRNGANAQELRVYTTDNGANDEYLRIFGQSGAVYQIISGATGSGNHRGITIGPQGNSATLSFQTQATTRWTIDANGNFIPFSDNGVDIGVSGTQRVKNIWAAATIGGNSLLQLQSGGVIEFGTGTRSKISSPSDGLILLQNTAATDFTGLILGSNDANGFRIKKNGTTSLDIKTGNDGAYAAVNASTITATTALVAQGSVTGTRWQYDAIDTITYAATTDINMTGRGMGTVSLTGDVTFTTSARLAGRGRTIRVVGDGSVRNLTFPAWSWTQAAPATLAANKKGYLTLVCWGSNDADIQAKWEVEP